MKKYLAIIVLTLISSLLVTPLPVISRPGAAIPSRLDITKPVKIGPLATAIRPTSDLDGMSAEDLKALGLIKEHKRTVMRRIRVPRAMKSNRRLAMAPSTKRRPTARVSADSGLPINARFLLNRMLDRTEAPIESREIEPIPTQPLKLSAKAYYTIFVPQTYFVRNGGGTAAQCTGLANVDYDGSGSAEACALSGVPDAITAVTYGDTIKLRAGQTFDTPGAFVSFDLIDKGTAPTGTDADYITITTDDTSGTPVALSGYPASDTRITTAMAANMPRVRTVGSYPVFWINRNSEYWKIERLNITNVTGSSTIRLIGLGETNPESISEYPNRIIIQLNWIHPAEEDGTVLSSGNLVRSAENGIYFEGTNSIIRQNAIQGFVGRDGGGGTLTSAGHLMTTWADNFTVENNLIEAWTYAIFYGGGTKNFADPAQTATVSSCNSTSCVFTTTNGLAVDEPVAILVYSFVDGQSIFREVWGTAIVESFSGAGNLTVNFAAPLCNSNNTDGNGNNCKPFDVNNLQQIPSDGAVARWEGFQVQNVTVRRNIFAHRTEWTMLMGEGGDGNCGGKGYLELKSCHNCTFDANVFKGCTGPTITTRNQAGSDPWNDLDNLTFSNNYWMNANAPFTAYLNDDGNLTSRSQNVTFTNNLVVGEFANPDAFNSLRRISGNFNGGDNVSITHNTVLVGSEMSFSSVPFPASQMRGLTIENNIFRVARNSCFQDGAFPTILDCWPAAVVQKNVLIKIDSVSTQEEIDQTWLDPFPDNFFTTSLSSVGFTSTDAELTAAGNYRLLSSSPYFTAGTFGVTPGVNYPQLIAALGFDPTTGAPATTTICKWNTAPRCITQ